MNRKSALVVCSLILLTFCSFTEGRNNNSLQVDESLIKLFLKKNLGRLSIPVKNNYGHTIHVRVTVDILNTEDRPHTKVIVNDTIEPGLKDLNISVP
jgi:hypothetical protein